MRHIWSCTSGEKWCHLQATMFGLPATFGYVVLLAVTVAMTFTRGDDHAVPIAGHAKVLKIAAWLSLLLVAAVLVSLFGAVVHNSR